MINSLLLFRKGFAFTMLILVSYDIIDNKKRSRLATKLKDYGNRVQKSVFEADVHGDEIKTLEILLQNFKLKDSESIRLYRLCADCVKQVKIFGKGKVTKDENFYIV